MTDEERAASIRAAQRKHRLANREKFADHTQTRLTRKRSLFVETVRRRTVFNRDQGICHLCSTAVDPEDWHLDHVIPLSLGGPHCYANTAVAHPTCNTAKNGRLAASMDTARMFEALAAYALFWSTQGTKARREPTPSGLDADMVRRIRAEHAAGGVSLNELGRRYGVRGSTIHAVVSRRTWKHVD